MEIQRQEIFRSQWHDIHDIVLSEAKRQIKFNGKVDVQRLTEKLQKEIAKWPQGVLAQGMWFQSFHNAAPDKALNFMTEAMEQSFIEPDNNKLPSNSWYFVLAFVLTGIVAWLLHSRTSMSLIEQCFYPTLFLVVLNTFNVSFRNKRIAKAEKMIITNISHQMLDMEISLEKYIEWVSLGYFFLKNDINIKTKDNENQICDNQQDWSAKQ